MLHRVQVVALAHQECIGAEDLDHQLPGVAVPVRPVQLSDRRLGARVATLQHRLQHAVVAELHDPQPAPRLGEFLTHDRIAGEPALGRDLDQLVHLALECRLEGKHRCAGALVAQRAHHDAPAAIHSADDVVGRRTRVGEEHLGELAAAGHVADRAHFDTRLIHRHQHHRDALVLGDLTVRAAQHVDPIGVSTERRPNLLAVDHPLIAIAHSRGAQAGEVAARLRLAEPLTPELAYTGDLG